mmetsp:Transcript_10619/g.20139  ORF Transcript_10619/g.20139 Transcript_10619/m.20139 type:complete len:378 (+) Transcript_10619:82-1215(+)
MAATQTIPCFSYDPAEAENVKVEEKVAPSPQAPQGTVSHGRQEDLGLEKFAGKFFTSSKLADAAELEAEIANQLEAKTACKRTGSFYESPLERLLRMREELNNLKQDLTGLAAVESDPAMEALSKNLNQLQTEMTTVCSKHKLATLLPHDYVASGKVLQRPAHSTPEGQQLLHQLQLASSSTDPQVRYSLFSQDLASGVVPTLEVEPKLTAMERIVGDTATASKDFATLFQALQNLLSTANLLDTTKLDSLLRRSKSLRTEIELFEQQKTATEGAPPSAAQADRIASLSTLVQRCSSDVSNLPTITKKIVAKEKENTAASNVLIRLQRLQQQQKDLQAVVDNDREGLQQLASSFQANMGVLNANVTALCSRLDKLNS